MHKMLFNTGVKFNHTIPLMPFQKWIGGVKQIEYFLENEPPKGAILLYLCDGQSIPENTIKIKIVKGGVCSQYAIFLNPITGV